MKDQNQYQKQSKGSSEKIKSLSEVTQKEIDEGRVYVDTAIGYLRVDTVRAEEGWVRCPDANMGQGRTFYSHSVIVEKREV